MEAAGGDTAPLVANTNGSVKKIFRARKTMTVSCRQQMATLTKRKCPSKMESTVMESLPVLPTETVQQSELMCEAVAQNNSASKINNSQSVYPNGLTVSIEVSQVDSGFNIGCSYKEVCEETAKKFDDLASGLLATVSDPVHFSHTNDVLVNDASSATLEPQLNVRQVTSPTNTGNQVLGERGLQTPVSNTVQDLKKDGPQTDVDDCRTVSEDLNASITLKIVNEDNCLKKTSSIGLVTPISVEDTASSITAISSNELNTAVCTNHSSTAPAFTLNTTAESDSGSPSQNCIAADGGCQRKRAFSGSSDVPDSKRAKTSNEVILNEIQCIIESRIQHFFKEAFDQRMQDLSQQVGLIQCNGSHADNIARHLKSIRRLERRIKYAVQAQNKVGTRSSKLPSVSSACDEGRGMVNTNACLKQAADSSIQKTSVEMMEASENPADTTNNASEPPTTEATLSAPTMPPTAESAVSHSERPSAQSLHIDSMELVVLSDNESEQRKPERIKTERPTCPPKKVDSAAMRKIMESIKQHRNRAHSSGTDKQTKTIIDLTDDEEQKSDKETASQNQTAPEAASHSQDQTAPEAASHSQDQAAPDSKLGDKCASPHENISASPGPIVEHVIVEKPPDKDLEKKEEISLNNKNEAATNHDVSEGKQSVPKSPKKQHDTTALQKTSPNPDPALLKPPQKPELRLAQVQNPKGIALSWNVTSIDPGCAPANAYCLYVHQEDPNIPKKLWKKIGEIKALPLPMACTLTQFVDDTTYSFAMRAKDASGRFGPLCDIQTTTLKPVNSSKTI